MCCENPFHIECVNHCDPFDTEIISANNETYTVFISFGNNKRSFDIEVLANENIIIPTTELNESAIQKIQIKDSNGDVITFIESGVEYDCFTVNVFVKHD